MPLCSLHRPISNILHGHHLSTRGTSAWVQLWEWAGAERDDFDRSNVAPTQPRPKSPHAPLHTRATKQRVRTRPLTFPTNKFRLTAGVPTPVPDVDDVPDGFVAANACTPASTSSASVLDQHDPSDNISNASTHQRQSRSDSAIPATALQIAPSGSAVRCLFLLLISHVSILCLPNRVHARRAEARAARR
ncbi:uncharacterized protein LAESUDRAFT_787073 [Laetiporus sulphureus 93-53]|uniref:Uncharacterized protein n=1 Tax=Laetiporus sulphureus 93-53 TaxID=1314785 RepID=A0A165D066_9APHY|nr:uncharacterized protein LAESUDRAFT_787073 [Laetiporus sulphureus 93-53]KZT03871.1 hypothetical protein LAESUDRAFT_787073 [Laetiporus sulphureus 93-53]